MGLTPSTLVIPGSISTRKISGVAVLLGYTAFDKTPFYPYLVFLSTTYVYQVVFIVTVTVLRSIYYKSCSLDS
jgi:hypothetical protein